MSQSVALDRRKLFEQVATYLERDILAGALKPGDRLPPERDLQQRFGVGRPAIREALIILQRSGLVELRNGAGARVAIPSASSIVAGMVPAVQQMLSGRVGQRQLQDVRLFMEVGLVRHAAVNASAEELETLGRALEANCAAIGNVEAFIRTDVGFHYCLARMMRNPAFTALHDAMSTWLEFQRRVALQEPDEDRRGYEAHARVFAAVVARDADAAEAAMRAHLAAGWVAFWNRYEEEV
jgi:GntR family transcriptional repressor for pyruvate dehydrogenase complex